MNKRIVVMTGDLVESRVLDSAGLAAAFDALAAAFAALNDWPGVSARMERYRGDGWQGLVSEGRLALRAAIFIRASLRALDPRFDTRLAAAIGDAAVDARALADHDEAVFVRSGKRLDTLPARTLMALDMDDERSRQQAAAFHLADALIADWTARQCQVMALALHPDAPTQAELADRLGIQQQSVQKTLSTCGFAHLQLALDVLEWSGEEPETQ